MPEQNDRQSEEEDSKRRLEREKLLQKVSCPLHIKVEKKVFEEEQERYGKKTNKMIKRGVITLTKLPNNFKNPWERTAQIQPDGTFKVKQGIERLLLSNEDQQKFIDAVRVNAKFKNFRDKALQMGKEVTIKLEGEATLEDV